MRSLSRVALIAGSICGLLAATSGSLAMASPSSAAAGGLYLDDGMQAELRELVKQAPDRMSLDEIGVSAEHRQLQVVHLKASSRPKPAMLLIFAEHANEHDTTLLAMALIRRLAQRDPSALDLLNRCDLYVLPMMNPDGVDYDLSGRVPPFSWRANHRKLLPGVWGVDLNRNWGTGWKPGASASTQGVHTGPFPFSEAETRAVRDFLLAHREIRVFLDEHSGSSSFNQGEVLYPYSSDNAPTMPQAVAQGYQDVAERVASLLTVPTDPRPAYVALRSPDVRDYVRKELAKHVPPAHLKQALATVPLTTGVSGASIDWTQQNLGILSLGIEASRGFWTAKPIDYARLANQGLSVRVDRTIAALRYLASVRWPDAIRSAQAEALHHGEAGDRQLPPENAPHPRR